MYDFTRFLRPRLRLLDPPSLIVRILLFASWRTKERLHKWCVQTSRARRNRDTWCKSEDSSRRRGWKLRENRWKISSKWYRPNVFRFLKIARFRISLAVHCPDLIASVPDGGRGSRRDTVKADLRSVSVNDLYWRGRRDLISGSGGDLALVAVFPADVYLFDTLTDKTSVRNHPISLFVNDDSISIFFSPSSRDSSRSLGGPANWWTSIKRWCRRDFFLFSNFSYHCSSYFQIDSNLFPFFIVLLCIPIIVESSWISFHLSLSISSIKSSGWNAGISGLINCRGRREGGSSFAGPVGEPLGGHEFQFLDNWSRCFDTRPHQSPSMRNKSAPPPSFSLVACCWLI